MKDTTKTVLAERGTRYGVFKDQAETSVAIALRLMAIMQKRQKFPAADQFEAVRMICVKLSRIAHGDPDYEDNWRDIAGYATLVADRLLADQKETAT